MPNRPYKDMQVTMSLIFFTTCIVTGEIIILQYVILGMNMHGTILLRSANLIIFTSSTSTTTLLYKTTNLSFKIEFGITLIPGLDP